MQIVLLWPRKITAIGIIADSYYPQDGAIYKVGNNALCNNPHVGDYTPPNSNVYGAIGWTQVVARARYVCYYRSAEAFVLEMYITGCECESGMYGEVCACNAGTTGPNHGPCAQCAAAKYKTESGSGACSACPANTNSPEGSTKVTDCTCNAGWAGGDGGPCEAVSCEHGYSGLPGYCIACPPGTYQANSSDATCQDCVHSKSSAVEAATECEDCVAGKYKQETSESQCASCAADTYSETVGSASNETCEACPAGSTSIAASDEQTDCVCDYETPGQRGGPCVMCVAGKYTGDPAAHDGCLTCPDHSNSPVGSISAGQCTCNVGSTPLPLQTPGGGGGGSTGSEGRSCVLCTGGKYKTSPGPANCSSCLPGEFSKTIGAAENLCEQCQPHSNALDYITCLCNAGFTGEDDNACTVCPPGTFKVEAGAVPCSTCLAGTYSNAPNSTECTSCVSHSDSPSGSTGAADCTCNSGATGTDGGEGCVLCEPGTYKRETGPAACTPCGVGKFSAVVGSAVNECVCNAGYTGPDGVEACSACSTNTYKPAPGDTECTSCEEGSHSVVLGATDNQCTCNVGFTGADAGVCTQCIANTYKNAPRAGACTPCQIYAESPLQSTSVHQCICEGGFMPEESELGSMECVCENQAEDIVRACGPGYDEVCPFYVKTINSSPVWAPEHALDGDIATLYAVAVFGTTWDNPIPYIEFDLGIPRNIMAIRTMTVQSDRMFIHNAQIMVGYSSGCSGTQCGNAIATTSPTGPTRQCRAMGRYICIRHVQTSAYSQAFFGVGEVHILGCVPFFCPSPCYNCPKGKFSTHIGDFPCKTCPLYSSAPIGSVDQAACVCKAGSTGTNGTACSLCMAGTYKPLPGDGACTLCPRSQYSEVVWASDATTCRDCPALTVGPLGSDNPSACGCVAGATRQNEGPCVLCAAGKYKAATGGHACTFCQSDQYSETVGASTQDTCQNCSIHAISMQGSVNRTACVCDVGTYTVAQE